AIDTRFMLILLATRWGRRPPSGRPTGSRVSHQESSGDARKAFSANKRRRKMTFSAHQVAIEPGHQALLDVALMCRLRDRVPFVRIDHQLRRHVERLERVP